MTFLQFFPWFFYGSPRTYVTDRQGLTWQQTFFKRVISLYTAPLGLLAPEWTVVMIALCRWGHRVARLLLEEDFSSLWVVEVVDHVGLITCGGGSFGQSARLLIWRSSAVFVGRQRDLRGCSWWTDRGRRCECYRCRVRAREMRRCKHGWHGDELVFMRTTQPWAWATCESTCECDSCVTGECACRSVNGSVNNWTETHYQLERQTCPSQVEGQTFPSHLKQNKGTRKKHSFFVFSHMLGTSNSDFNTVRSLNVSGQWSREFQPLCFPYLDSPDS